MSLQDEVVNKAGFAFRSLMGQDQYAKRTEADVSFAAQFPAITLVGTGSYTLRWRDVGKACQFEIEFKSTTTVASTAGISYFILPIRSFDSVSLQPYGKGGIAQMSNVTTNVAVGLCVIDLVNAQCYLPTQAASGNTFQVSGWYPIG